MDNDSFDTYVTSKGFVFMEEVKDKNREGVSYALNLSKIDNSRALKFITLYQRFLGFKYSISYQTSDRNEYVNIKNQIKSLGFKLYKSEIFNSDDGESSNNFMYVKGKETISLFAGSTSFEINYHSLTFTPFNY